MPNTTLEPALGYLVLSFLTWSVTFAVIVFGVMLRRKILLWDDSWRETVEAGGMPIKDYADDLQRTFEKIRSTFRWLGFCLLVFLLLMGWVAYLGFLEKPVLGMPQVLSGLWLLILIVLSVILPAYVNFGVGAYVAETMLLKANAFVVKDVRGENRVKKAKLKVMEKSRQMKEKREALKAAAAAQTAPGPGAP
jgi:hypothetical protein